MDSSSVTNFLSQTPLAIPRRLEGVFKNARIYRYGPCGITTSAMPTNMQTNPHRRTPGRASISLAAHLLLPYDDNRRSVSWFFLFPPLFRGPGGFGAFRSITIYDEEAEARSGTSPRTRDPVSDNMLV